MQNSMPITHTVRSATVRDAKAIARVHAAVIQALRRERQSPDRHGGPSLEEHQAYWREAIEYSEPQVKVVIEGDAMVGFVGFDRSRDKGTPSTTGEIWALCVLPAHWRQGVGSALWEAAQEGLKEEGCTRVTVWVSQRDLRALMFFEHAGFKREGAAPPSLAAAALHADEIRLWRELV
jgi:ribosomal protein S18 acetylase RimI-like enzyme